MTLLILLFMVYPVAIFSFVGFSVIPAIIYVKTKPLQIGEKEEFYQRVFQYCNSSQNQREFDSKLIIINFICLKRYKTKLIDDSTNADYHQFVQWFSEKEKELSNITIKQFQEKTSRLIVNSTVLFTTPDPLLLLLSVKSFQVLVRAIFITLSIFFDICYFKTFSSESHLRYIYGDTILILGVIGVVLFLIWIPWAYVEIFSSKWNYFCSHMITPKHPKFILTESATSFIEQCDTIYHKTLSRQENEVKSEEDEQKQNDNNKCNATWRKLKRVISGNIRFFTVSTSIINCAITAVSLAPYNMCSKYVYFVATLQLLMLTITLTLLIYESCYNQNRKKFYDLPGILVSAEFAVYSSSLFISLFQYNYCQFSNIMVSSVILQVVGFVICVLFGKYIAIILTTIIITSILVLSVAISIIINSVSGLIITLSYVLIYGLAVLITSIKSAIEVKNMREKRKKRMETDDTDGDRYNNYDAVDVVTDKEYNDNNNNKQDTTKDVNDETKQESQNEDMKDELKDINEQQPLPEEKYATENTQNESENETKEPEMIKKQKTVPVSLDGTNNHDEALEFHKKIEKRVSFKLYKRGNDFYHKNIVVSWAKLIYAKKRV
eukprot:222167_1